MNKRDVKAQGYKTGYDIARENAYDVFKQWTKDPGVSFVEMLVEEALQVESEHYRQFSPFESFAAAVNRSRDPDGLWEAYETGVHAGANAAAQEAAEEYRNGLE